MKEAFDVLEMGAFKDDKSVTGISEDEFRFLLSKVKPSINPKEVKKFLDDNQQGFGPKGFIRGDDAIKHMKDEIANPIKKSKKGKGKGKK